MDPEGPGTCGAPCWFLHGGGEIWLTRAISHVLHTRSRAQRTDACTHIFASIHQTQPSECQTGPCPICLMNSDGNGSVRTNRLTGTYPASSYLFIYVFTRPSYCNVTHLWIGNVAPNNLGFCACAFHYGWTSTFSNTGRGTESASWILIHLENACLVSPQRMTSQLSMFDFNANLSDMDEG